MGAAVGATGRRRARQSSPLSARQWNGLDSRGVGEGRRHGRRVHHRKPPRAGVSSPPGARPVLSEGARSHTRQVVRRQTEDVGWMARASDPPPASSVDARSDAACRVVRPASGLPARARRLMRRASWRKRGRRSSCDQGRPCVRTPGGWTPSQCARIVIRWRRSTVTRRRWAVSGSPHVPMPGLNSTVRT